MNSVLLVEPMQSCHRFLLTLCLSFPYIILLVLISSAFHSCIGRKVLQPAFLLDLDFFLETEKNPRKNNAFTFCILRRGRGVGGVVVLRFTMTLGDRWVGGWV